MVYNGNGEVNSRCLGVVTGGHLCVDQKNGFMFFLEESYLCTDICVRHSPNGI